MRGNFHLWIYCCHWTITLEDDFGAHSESSREEVAIALAHLRGQTLHAVSVSPKKGSSTFEFDLGGKLNTDPYEKPDREGNPYVNWMLFDNEKRVLVYRADGIYSDHPSNEANKEWLV